MSIKVNFRKIKVNIPDPPSRSSKASDEHLNRTGRLVPWSVLVRSRPTLTVQVNSQRAREHFRKHFKQIENRGFQRVSEEFRGVQRIPEDSREFQRTLLPKTLLKTLRTPKNTSENTSKHIPNTKNTSKHISGSQESPGWLSGLTWACFAWRGGNLLGP